MQWFRFEIQDSFSSFNLIQTLRIVYNRKGSSFLAFTLFSQSYHVFVFDLRLRETSVQILVFTVVTVSLFSDEWINTVLTLTRHWILYSYKREIRANCTRDVLSHALKLPHQCSVRRETAITYEAWITLARQYHRKKKGV